MNFNVAINLGLSYKSLPANLTHKRFLPGMNRQMIVQPLPSPKRFIARTTFMRGVIRVSPSMYVNAIRGFKRFPAYMTNVRPFPGMGRPMIVPRVFRGERPTAHVATEPFNFIVNLPHMPRYVFFL